MTSRFAIAKEKLLGDVEAVAADLFGGNARPRDRSRSMWKVTNPWRAKAKRSQMVVWLTGARRGGWRDFVSGDKGDVIDLVAFVQWGIVTADTRMRAVEWAEDRYGLKRLDPKQRAELAAQADKRRKAVEEGEAKSQAQQRERVRKMFFGSAPLLAGTPVERYLASRGIDLADIPNLTHSFRFRADCEYWPLAPVDGEGRRIGPGPRYPALVSAMVSPGGHLNALHLTFLAADGRGKAPVAQLAAARGLDADDYSAKLFKGDVSGFVIRATNGPSGLSAEDAAAAGISGLCALTEGIEDALSVAVADPRLRLWAAGSLSGLLHVPDHACVSAWLVFKDNDWGKPQAAALFARAVNRLRSFKKPVEVIAMPADWGKDVNDAIRAT